MSLFQILTKQIQKDHKRRAIPTATAAAVAPLLTVLDSTDGGSAASLCSSHLPPDAGGAPKALHGSWRGSDGDGSRCSSDNMKENSSRSVLVVRGAVNGGVLIGERSLLLSDDDDEKEEEEANGSSSDSDVTDPFERLLVENESLANEVTEKADRIQKLEEEASEREAEMSLVREELQAAKSRSDSLEAEAKALRAELGSVSCRLADATEELERTRRDMADNYKKVHDESKLLADSAAKRVRLLAKKLEQKASENAEMKYQLENFSATQSKFLPQLMRENKELVRALTSEKCRQSGLERELKRANEKLRMQEKVNDKLRHSVQELEGEVKPKGLVAGKKGLSSPLPPASPARGQQAKFGINQQRSNTPSRAAASTKKKQFA